MCWLLLLDCRSLVGEYCWLSVLCYSLTDVYCYWLFVVFGLLFDIVASCGVLFVVCCVLLVVCCLLCAA